MKCIKCGRYPFCEKIENPQQEACNEFIKRLRMNKQENSETYKKQ